MERSREELMLDQASQLFVSGIAQAIAVHVARNYAETVDEVSPRKSIASGVQTQTNHSVDGATYH